MYVPVLGPIMPDKLQIIGLCRFSYPTAEGSGFTTGATPEGHVPAVYDHGRLHRRLWLFRHICLPGITGQTDRDFSLIILVGQTLPDFARQALEEMIAGHPQLRLQVEPEFQRHDEICAQVLLDARHPRSRFVAEFGMDDDDCVAVTFIAETRRIFAQCRDLITSEGRLELDFCRGFAMLAEDGRLSFKQVVAPHWNCAQVILQPAASPLSLFNFHHFRFWKRHTSFSFAREPMFIRSFHGHNDSGNRWAGLKPNPGPQEEADLLPVLRQRFALDLAAAQASFLATAGV